MGDVELLEYLNKYFVIKGYGLHRKSSGRRVGYQGTKGYIDITVNGKRFLEHRLIFFMLNGWWPEVVDHINGIRDDNRPENLRASTPKLNGQNKGGKGCPKRLTDIPEEKWPLDAKREEELLPTAKSLEGTESVEVYKPTKKYIPDYAIRCHGGFKLVVRGRFYGTYDTIADCARVKHNLGV